MRIDKHSENKEFRNKVITKLHFHPIIANIQVGENKLIAQLDDGRELSIPTSWFKRLFLQEISLEKFRKYEILPRGHSVLFPEIDEILHVRTFTDGLNARC